MSKDKYIKAEATTLNIGDLEFDAIRLSGTGEYRMSQEQTLAAIDEPKNWFSRLRKRGGVSAKTLLDMGLEWLRAENVLWVEYQNKDGKTVKAASRCLDDVDGCWEYHAETGNTLAKRICRALRRDSLEDRFKQVYEEPRASKEERKASDNRVMQQNAPYDALYQKEVCERAFSWFGCQFYWSYFYFWMSRQEKCDLDNRNPPINGRRKTKIHQWIEPETKERLRDKAIELGALILAARSKQQFIELFQNRYGEGWQKDIFD
jgi:hypothetical protein